MTTKTSGDVIFFNFPSAEYLWQVAVEKQSSEQTRTLVRKRRLVLNDTSKRFNPVVLGL